MKQFFKLKRLSQRGIVHHMAPVVVIIVLIGVTGSFFYFRTQAAQPWSGALTVGPSGSNYCMDAPSLQSGQPVVLNACNSKSVNQKWQLMSAGTVSGGGKTVRAYTIETFAAGKFLCVDDWQQSTAQGKNNPLKLYNCNGVDPAQRFFWAGDGHQLRNVSSFLCIDNQGGVLKAKNPIDLYKCKSTGTANQDWYEIGNSAAAASAPTNNPPANPTTPPPSGGGGGECDFAAVHDACENELNSGSGTTFPQPQNVDPPASSTPPSAFGAPPSSTGSSSSPSNSDINAMLLALKKYDPSFQCSSLSNPSNVAECETVFHK